MMPSIDLIRAERYRQKQSEGYDEKHDAGHAHELALAAAAYALDGIRDTSEWDLFPWDKKYWKPKDAERNLIRAGALIVAALDSLRSNTK